MSWRTFGRPGIEKVCRHWFPLSTGFGVWEGYKVILKKLSMELRFVRPDPRHVEGSAGDICCAGFISTRIINFKPEDKRHIYC